jgi:hypothetical protein
MNQYFENKLDTIKLHISRLTKYELDRDESEANCARAFKLNPLKINRENIRIYMGEEEIYHHNAPLNVSYKQGQKMDYAEYTIPIQGDRELIRTALNHLTNKTVRDEIRLENNSIIIRKYSQDKIVGNPESQKNISDIVRQMLMNIESQIEDFNNEIYEYSNKLVEVIKREIILEKIRRSETEDAINNLKL